MANSIVGFVSSFETIAAQPETLAVQKPDSELELDSMICAPTEIQDIGAGWGMPGSYVAISLLKTGD